MIGATFTIYRVATGEIASSPTVVFPEDHRQAYRDAALAPWGAAEHAVVEAPSDAALHYVGTLGGEPAVLDRPAMLVQVSKTAVAAGGADEAAFTGLPDPCTVVVDAPDPLVETTVHEVAGGGFAFAAADPGTYTIEIRYFPFLPYRVEITAT